MGKISSTVKWRGQQLTLGELREFIGHLVDVSDAAVVFVDKEPSTPHPTDPGGTITLACGAS